MIIFIDITCFLYYMYLCGITNCIGPNKHSCSNKRQLGTLLKELLTHSQISVAISLLIDIHHIAENGVDADQLASSEAS